MDGIAIAFETFEQGVRSFKNTGMARAGMPQVHLRDVQECIEIATGAVLPQGTDTVIRYEDLERRGEFFHIKGKVRFGQSIHKKGR